MGEHVTVKGLYAGGGIIYAENLSPCVEHGYKDVSIAELKGFSAYYHDHSVRVEGNVRRIEHIAGRTKLRIDDNTGTIDVDYGNEIEDIKLNEAVIIEGKFCRDRIYAVSIEPKYKKTGQSGPERSSGMTVSSIPEPQTETPAMSAPTTTAAPALTPTSASAPGNDIASHLYLLAVFASGIVMIIVTKRR